MLGRQLHAAAFDGDVGAKAVAVRPIENKPPLLAATAVSTSLAPGVPRRRGPPVVALVQEKPEGPPRSMAEQMVALAVPTFQPGVTYTFLVRMLCPCADCAGCRLGRLVHRRQSQAGRGAEVCARARQGCEDRGSLGVYAY